MAMDVKEFQKYLSRLEKDAETITQEAVKQATLIADAEAKKKAPVDTGNLRASISMEVDGLEGTVGTNVEYAPFVEYGTSRQPAQPFMEPAKYKAERELQKILKREARNYVRD